MKRILEIKGLKKVYKSSITALKNISFDVYEKEFLVIIGPSGAGKSTLLRCINRLIDPTDGKINFLDEEISGLKASNLRKARSQIGMIFQNYNLVSRSSVLENVMHGTLGQINELRGLLSLYSKDEIDYAIKLLNQIGLQDHIYKRGDELSGGQMQRVGICRALNQKPKLMLADEPISSLDPKTSIDVMDALYSSCVEEGIACIANLHQVDVALKYATRIIGIKDGDIVYDGLPSDLSKSTINNIYEGKMEYAV